VTHQISNAVFEARWRARAWVSIGSPATTKAPTTLAGSHLPKVRREEEEEEMEEEHVPPRETSNQNLRPAPAAVLKVLEPMRGLFLFLFFFFSNTWPC
jgi:hypothetical protein